MSVVRWTPSVLLMLLASLTPRMAAAATHAGGCPPPTDPHQVELDQAGLTQARAGGLSLNLVRQCAGFSVVVQDGMDPAVAAEYAKRAEQDYSYLSAETGEQLPPRAVLLVFTDQDSMAAGERVLGGIYSAVREPRAGYTWLNTVWLDDSMHPWPGARAQAVAHEFSHLFAAFTARGKAIPSWFDERLAVDSEITLPRDDFAVVSDAQATYEQGLEYAQAYMTVEAALERGGRPAAWRALHAMGDEGLDFPSAFESAFGLSVDDLDAHARAAWQSQLL